MAVPTIKGIFVMSHVRALERERGKEARMDLEKRFGGPIAFGNNQNVPIHDEVKIIELTLDILYGNRFRETERGVGAGKLHFRNFSETPLGKLVLPLCRSNCKSLLIYADNIAGLVFKGVTFESHDLGPTAVRLTMFNNDYPIEHFKGFFEAWLEYCNVNGSVDAKDRGDGTYEYLVRWIMPITRER